MANVKAIIKQIGLFLDTTFKNNINANFENLAQKDYDNYAELDSRIDTIITTPIDGEGSAQELVDARKGKATLGAKIDEMDAAHAAHLADDVQVTQEGQTEPPHGLPKCKYDALVEPTADNDSTEGYSVGSEWIDVTHGNSYKCLDTTEGAAVWQKSSVISVVDFRKCIDVVEQGAIGDNTADDTAKLLECRDKSKTFKVPLYFPNKVYKTTAQIVIDAHNFEIIADQGAVINYYGIDTALKAALPDGKAVVNLNITNLAVTANDDGATAVELTCSYSLISSLNLAIKGSNSVGLKLVGEATGTGSYYNTFLKTMVQGCRGITGGLVNQKGIVFTTNSNRIPNANTFIGGRVGQVDDAWTIFGCGNNIYSPTVEAIYGTAFIVNHPNNIIYCNDNTIQNCYAEVGDKLYDFGVNSSRTRLEIGYVTGFPGTNVDNGTNSLISWAGEIQKIAIGTNNSVRPGLILNELFKIGIYIFHLNPEGYVIAYPGSLCLVGDGTSSNVGKLYRKASGVGNTGWVEVT